MSDNLSLPASGVTVATKDLAGIHHQKFIPCSSAGTEHVQPLTDTQLRATAVPVSGTVAVTGTFYQVTQPVSGPLTDTQLRATAVPVSGTFYQVTQPVSGTFWQTTQPVSLATNTPDVTDRSGRLLGHVTVDNASIAVTGTFYQATQPISGTVTANAGTNLNTSALSLDATLTGGTQRNKLTDGTNNVGVADSSTASSETTTDRLKVNSALRLLDTAQSAGSQLVAAKGDQTSGLWVNVKNASVAVTGTFWQVTQPVSGTVTLGAGSALAGKVGIDQTTPGTTNKVSIGTDGTVTLGAGTAAFGKLSANSGVIIGDVNLVSAIPAGTNAIGKLAANSGVNIGDLGTVATVTAVTGITNAVTIKADTAGNQANALKVDGSAVTQPASIAAGVSLGYSTGKTNVLKTGTLASSATTADQVVLTYTVTTGKTFYLEFIAWQARLTTYAATATNFGAVSLETPSGTKVITHDVAHVGDTYPHVIQFAEPIPVASTVVIRVVCTPAAVTAMTWRASFGGYEK